MQVTEGIVLKEVHNTTKDFSGSTDATLYLCDFFGDRLSALYFSSKSFYVSQLEVLPINRRVVETLSLLTSL